MVCCAECGPEACPTCRRNAELAEHVAAGPEPHDLHTTDLATVLAQQRADKDAYERATGFDGRTNSYRYRGKQ